MKHNFALYFLFSFFISWNIICHYIHQRQSPNMCQPINKCFESVASGIKYFHGSKWLGLYLPLVTNWCSHEKACDQIPSLPTFTHFLVLSTRFLLVSTCFLIISFSFPSRSYSLPIGFYPFPIGLHPFPLVSCYSNNGPFKILQFISQTNTCMIGKWRLREDLRKLPISLRYRYIWYRYALVN